MQIQGGRSRKSFESIVLNPENIQDVLVGIRNETIAELHASLKKVDRVSLGGLFQSIRVDLPNNDSVISFELYMEDYWKFVDEGVDGTVRKFGSQFKFKKKNINQRAALDFIAARGISQWKDKSGKVIFDVKAKAVRTKSIKGFGVASTKQLKKSRTEDRLKTLAFLVGRSISRRGVKPTNFYSDVITKEWKADFTKRVSVALKQDVTIVFKDIIETVNGNNNK